jgi:hypothetical protein
MKSMRIVAAIATLVGGLALTPSLAAQKATPADAAARLSGTWK